ncbi:16S rRNA processing protein RimM [hydrothermal vent metagenome]|uniref:16S rRNA processing protein RimM n=1 Tax=hydrothermal vent metagenome TaxID=652676 RepID=A0A3B1ANQ0_9ZZZZ
MIKSKYKNHTIAVLILISISVLVSASYFYTVEKRKKYLNNMVEYHTKMIKSGSFNSLVKLGEMYEKGEGVEKDLVKAKELFKKAINFNQYLDEINPSYSNNNTKENNSNEYDSISIEDDEAEINFEETPTDDPIDNLSAKNANNKKDKTNHIPYKKSTFSNIVVIESNKIEKKSKIKRPSSTTRQFKLQSNNTKIRELETAIEKTKKAADVNKKVKLKAQKKAKAIAIAKKKIKLKAQKKAKAIAIAKKKIKLKAQKKAKATAIAKKKIKLKAQKKAKATLKKKSVKTKFKKTKRITKRRKKAKKSRLEAKRAPSLNEQRPDINTDFGLDDSKENNPNAELEEVIEQQALENNFTSNPCDTESARYIAKCRRASRN